MTHSEDVKRVSSPQLVDYLNARIKALESRVEILEAKLEVQKQVNQYNNYNN
jgi:hypothetical protein